LVRAVILVKAPRTMTSSKIRKIEGVKEAFDVSGRFDAIALIEVKELPAVKETAMKIQAISGIRRTETLIEV
jgi:DNA-binding Lrp family transcriptional regulator